MTQKNKALIGLLVVLLLWGSSYSITKTIVHDFPPILFAVLRFVVASIVLLMMSLFRRPKQTLVVKNLWLKIFMLALSGVGLYYVLFNFSLQMLPASVGALLQGFIPVGVSILAAIFLKEHLNYKQIIGIIISISGVVILGSIEGAGSGDPNHSPLLGTILMILAVLCWCIYTVLYKSCVDMDPIWLTTRITIVGTLLLIPGLYFELKNAGPIKISTNVWIAIIYMGIFPSALSYLWYNMSLRYLKASFVGVLMNLDPVMGAVIAFVALSEPFSIMHLIGAALVIAGVFLSSGKSSEKAIAHT